MRAACFVRAGSPTEAREFRDDVEQTETLAESVRRIDDFRARRPEHPIHDVAHADLARDPVGTLQGIDAGLGIEPGPGGFDAVASYVEGHVIDLERGVA